MSDKEMEKALREKQAEAKQFRFDVTGGRVKNLKAGGNAKKAVARMMTEMRTRSNAN